jgi:hypothetical protein
MPNTKRPPRWRTAGGATVQLTDPLPDTPNGYAWKCGGCGFKGRRGPWPHHHGHLTDLHAIGDAASAHAAACTAPPM